MQKRWTANDVREAYLRFFEERGHARVPSASLVPENDPTTLFTGSGMQPLLPYLLGEKHPEGDRLVDSQKCFRAGDIEEVGDNRHTTFFEMLGNWSFGDYFKKEQIEWIFEFLTKELGLDPNRIYISAFGGNEKIGVPKDGESVKIWQEVFKKAGVEAEAGKRIFYYGEDKNWWSRSGIPANMPVGEPGGPDSEMFWDFGADRLIHENSAFKEQPCHINCDCGRYLEIGNNVFMEYRKTADGFKKLKQRNVDFGGGLERLLAAAQDEPDIFKIEVFDEAREVLERLSGKKYDEGKRVTQAFRVILDHLRAAVLLVGDGVLPDNKDQGYFARRLIRRAIRYGQKLGIERAFCAEVTGAIIENYRSAYGILANKRERIQEELRKEEEKFGKTLVAGLREFDRIAGQVDEISAKSAFDLYQSFGLPFEMIEEMAKERGQQVDTDGFKQYLVEHQRSSAIASAHKFKGGLADHSEISVKYHTTTHLLHQALREVLGDHVQQRGSNITQERLRFDFAHPEKMTTEQIKRVENLVNSKIKEDLPVAREEMSVPEAKAKGALGLFEEKYGERVSVYSIGDFSCEICGGPHVEKTGFLGSFKITKEESAGGGVRRVKAVLT